MTDLHFTEDNDKNNIDYLSIYQTMYSMVYVEPEDHAQYTPEELSIEGV